MADWISGLELLGAIATQPKSGRRGLPHDYALYSEQSQPRRSPPCVKAGTLPAEIAALARTSALAETLLADQDARPAAHRLHHVT